MKNITIRNDTPSSLELMDAGGRQLVLAPLELRQIDSEDFSGFYLSEAKRAGLISELTEAASGSGENSVSVVVTLGVLLTIGCGMVAGNPPAWSSGTRWKALVWITGGGVMLLGIVSVLIYLTKSLRLVARFVAQTLSLMVILAIGLGVPGAAVYFFGDGKALLAGPPSTKLFARLLQVSFIATASLLPVLMFFLFDRYQLKTLRNRLYRDLFRLDRGLTTRSEIDAKYGAQIEEAYGPEDQGRGRVAPGTRWPVLVCAFVMTMGWLSTLKPVAGGDTEWTQTPLLPERSALTFGFLGAYFFALQLIARRYARGDLQPKAYSYITIRILTVAVLSWVLDVFATQPHPVKLIAAFVIGVVPEEFFTLIRERFRGRGKLGKDAAKIVPEAEKHPLTKLEGIDLYERARLEQEGIVNVESFAHHDLIHLVLGTQIPVPQLVDWMDQAILYLHIVEESRSGEGQDTARRRLREFGIRTTTDLLACWDAADRRQELDGFKKLLGPDSKPLRLELVRDALLDDEWLARVQDWRGDAPRARLKVSAVPKTVEEKLSWARDLKRRGWYKEAVQTLLGAIEIRGDAGTHAELARLFREAPLHSVRDRHASRDHARRAFELGQDDVDLLIEVAEIHAGNGDVDDARKVSERAAGVIGKLENEEEKREARKRLETIQKDIERRTAAAGIVNRVMPVTGATDAGDRQRTEDLPEGNKTGVGSGK
jgi:hypothetical protein